ncbi:hypothetical protein [Paenibacillus thermotolerans]|uniref:hypothetical protein n=1 Tax=Paenibacillus thermotolerans TaxID=3027807 RepID=UPI00236764CF|nr:MULTISPECIES: hypothetical protein [unclassified Paenibacillus]
MSCVKCPPAGPVATAPTIVYNDIYHPQPVQVIQPIEIVNRHHCVPVPIPVTTVTVRDVYPVVPGAAIARVSRTKKKHRK